MSQPLPNKLIIPSQQTEVPAVVEAVLSEVAKHDYDEQARFAIRLALDEALINAIRHGNCCDAHKQVTVEYGVTDRECRIAISDEGCGFKPDRLPDCTRPENIERPHGRGVMLMKAYMSEVKFSRRGRTVTLVKRRKD